MAVSSPHVPQTHYVAPMPRTSLASLRPLARLGNSFQLAIPLRAFICAVVAGILDLPVRVL